VTSSYDIAISGDLKDTDPGAGEGEGDDMARLIDAQRMVLQAILDLSKDTAGYVKDTQIAQDTSITLKDVRDWLETLSEEGSISLARTSTGLSAHIEAKGRLDLGQSRPFPTSPSSHSAAISADPREPAQPQVGDVIDSSGNWVLLGGHFFEAKSVKQGGGVLTVVISTQRAEDDTAIQALGSARSGNDPIAFAHRNDALVVAVQDIESESVGEGLDWTIRLKPKSIEYGGLGNEMATEVNGKHYSADDIAELRAGRILLNDPPPRPRGSSKSDELSQLEMCIKGIDIVEPVERCVLRDLYARLGTDPTHYLRLARLAAIYALKAGDVVERVERLALGQIREDGVHVSFAGKRRKKFTNVEPHPIEIEGDCPLT
jgi:hypothetical protein